MLSGALRLTGLIMSIAALEGIAQNVGGSSQRGWEIPYASEGNTISLAVENSSALIAKSVSVTLTIVPDWLKFRSKSSFLKDIPPNSAGEAGFVFTVAKKAPVGKDTTIVALIATSDGQTWTKEIMLSIAPPKEYRLYTNFPNPFNPTTRIAFELPKKSHVRLVVYDVIGREVEKIAEGEYPAGYTELTWNGLNRDGNRVGSGVYFCRIQADRWSRVIKMMVTK